ncbi:penicillin acylase family protein [Paraferrimonas sedimenticola]|uniref:Penicillin acylase n=1 Tax=Paraferrimonas sedimenticola TaxID=375674 RepID=A0AA37W2G8_9GAMM|nr:penicillin acylase family protein [Paraferrimonas sedimenticola]GLP97782.1 penicillin acylase [Paraferrimonas sedimenticola]
MTQSSWWKRLLLSLVAVIVVALLAIWWVLSASKGQLDGELAVGVSAPVNIGFDAAKRPYVQSESLADALTAQGYLHASERLWQMELVRSAGRGELAVLFGRDMLDSDKSLWRMGVPQLGQRLYHGASDNMKALVEAYVLGVNAAIEQQSMPSPELMLLGAEVRPWQAQDVFAVGALIAFQSANNHSNELLRLKLSQKLTDNQMRLFTEDGSDIGHFPFIIADDLSELSETLASVDPDWNPKMPRVKFGSNGWVVAPEKSQSGFPLFAFDSHDQLGLPNLFYEVHLFIGDDAQIRGWSVPGLPGVINGYNQSIAWGFTNIGDTQDLYVETESSDQAHHYLHDGEYLAAVAERVELKVKGGESEPFTIYHTPNGPLISESPAISFSWTLHQLTDEMLANYGLEALLKLNQATNWDEFNQAIDKHAGPTLNATYADVHGNIGFRTAGILPVRGSGEGLAPLDGALSKNAWQGLVPATEMPRLLNPESGYIAAANARVNPKDFGVLVSADNAAPYRIERLQQVLSAAPKLTLGDMQGLQMDWYDGQAAKVLPSMLAKLNGASLSPQQTQAVELLQAWLSRPMATSDSAPALIFQHWYLSLANTMFNPVLGDELYTRVLKRSYVLSFAVDQALLEAPAAKAWDFDWPKLLSESLHHSLEQLAGELGPELVAWRLDDKQGVKLYHELGKAVPALDPVFNSERYPWGGTPAAVGRANYKYHTPFEVSHGATVRVVAEMSPQVRAKAVIPGGQSGHPLSDHYRDQFAAWLAGDLIDISAEPVPAQLTLTPN